MDFNQAEKEYRWLDAAKFYEQTLHSRLDSGQLAAETWEKIGSCYLLSSKQAKSVDEFKNLRQLAVETYETAAKLFGEEDSLESQGKKTECLANAEYARSWLANSFSEKAKMLDECCAFGKKALEAFKKSGDMLSFGKTCNILSMCLFDRFFITSTLEEKRIIVQEGIDTADNAVLVLSKLESNDELLLAYSLASLHCWHVANLSEQKEERKDLAKKCLSYSKNAVTLSKEVDNLYVKAMSMWARALSTLFFTEEIESSLEYAKEMLQYASVTRDNHLKGIACYLLAMITDGMVPGEEHPDKKKQKCEEIIKYSEDSIRYLQLVCQDSDIAETYLFYTQSYFYLAREIAVKPIEKLACSKKAVRIGEKGLEYAIRSGSVDAMVSTLHALSKAYYYYSKLESRKDEKPELLRTALGYRKEYIRTAEQAFASNLWIQGVGMVYAAQIEADLVSLETDRKNKTTLLESAVSDIESGVSHCNRWIGSSADASVIAFVADFEDTFGGMLHERYLLTDEKENLARANQVYDASAEKFKQVDLPSRVAESYWKIALNLDVIGDYQEAAKNFENAFAGYKAATKRIPQFEEFYLDYATYMKTWREIQTAKLAHTNGNYATAMKHYENAADLLKQSSLWNYLSPNFHAWSLLEQAEVFSRKERDSEAIEAFEKTIKLFQESQRILRAQLIKIDRTDEKNLVIKLIEASNTREEYCRGRIEIEEAKILDKKGDHAESSEKYGAAATTFLKISQADSEQIRKEIKPLIYLCQAWQKMTMAETRSSPILYEEASNIFKLANECSPTESGGLLALAHSNFCKALEAGTEFEITRNAMTYQETKKYMDAAANCYLKAGFETASEYANGTQRLFDGYVYMNSAKRETDPEKEAKYYLMAEKVLQNSVESFNRAGYAGKTNQVQRLLDKVREERKLALSLSEVFHAPTLTSTTASFATISPIEETAVGLERFEHADIQAKLIQHGDEIRVGENVNLEVQIVNVGREPVFLTKIENILPMAFQLVGKSDDFSSEDTHLILKGKRLDPLKTDEIKIVFRSFRMGTFEVSPRIICVDEMGRQMIYEPEAKIFKVLEAVISGRVTTGYDDLDGLLLGGIPENYAVVLTSPSSDERELLVKRFLEVGTKKGQVTFYVTVEPGSSRALAEEFQTNFYIFVCNPRADVMIPTLPNVFKLKGVESLTDLDIALTKSFRTLDAARSGPRRICIEIVSDVLLQHHAIIARKWLSGVLADLRAKSFTTLAIVNPQMHPQEEVQAILGLFEGEIRISEKETEKGIEKILRVRKLYNQRYLENELTLTRETLES
jgi:tetratricopeptide (TPR) repeat protein/KaiC/GvpD/RAD55 family RecA-like ATPase